MKEIQIESTLDKTLQPSLFHQATQAKRPLLVGLHTWSYDRHNLVDSLLPIAKENDWNLLLPEFRGANKVTNPEKGKNCGSPYAVQDVLDGIAYIKRRYDVDADNILLIGLSGGGHLGLLLTGYCPELFKAAIVYVPISDLARWHDENIGYGQDIEGCVGCKPTENAKEYALRSPISYVENIALANLKICHGKFDGVVPYTQSMDLYNKIMEIAPKSRVFLEIFDGGHEIDYHAAIGWLKTQMEKRTLLTVTG